MKNVSYPLAPMRESLTALEREALKLRELSKGIPAIEKNLDPVMTFIDILKHHIFFPGAEP